MKTISSPGLRAPCSTWIVPNESISARPPASINSTERYIWASRRVAATPCLRLRRLMSWKRCCSRSPAPCSWTTAMAEMASCIAAATCPSRLRCFWELTRIRRP